MRWFETDYSMYLCVCSAVLAEEERDRLHLGGTSQTLGMEAAGCRIVGPLLQKWRWRESAFTKHSHTFSTCFTLLIVWSYHCVHCSACRRKEEQQITFGCQTLGMEAAGWHPFSTNSSHFLSFWYQLNKADILLDELWPGFFLSPLSYFYFWIILRVCMPCQRYIIRWRPSSDYSSQLSSGGFYSCLL